jgi:CBS domain containing-hemolysin-like protein
VDDLWGEWGVLAAAGVLTAAILFMGEITPKLIGVTYSKTIAPIVAFPVLLCVKLLAPLLWVSSGISSLVKADEPQQTMSHHEVKSMAEIGQEEGALDEFEGEVIQNVIGLDEIIVREILTPRVVVFRLREDLTVAEVEKELPDWSHSRVPIYPEDDPEHLSGYVLQRDVFREAVRGNKTTTLKQIARQLPVVPELMRADRLLLRMIDKREHICAVVDEHGSLAGIVTLEDTMEELVGKEIVDEYDAVADLRTFAGLLRVVRNRRRQSDGATNAPESGAHAATGVGAAAGSLPEGALLGGREQGKQGPNLERVLREARKLKAQRGGEGPL